MQGHPGAQGNHYLPTGLGVFGDLTAHVYPSASEHKHTILLGGIYDPRFLLWRLRSQKLPLVWEPRLEQL